MHSFHHIKVSVDSEKGYAVICFNRPAKRNAFTQAMIDEIVTALQQLDALDQIRAVVVTGGTDSPFCGDCSSHTIHLMYPGSCVPSRDAADRQGIAGMDLNDLRQISTAEAHRRCFLKDLTDAFGHFSKPTIAAINGYALGGGFEMALACDIIYAAEDARLGLPEIKIGTIPGAGGTQRLARALGKHKAMEFILTGDSASGAEFESLGVVNKSLPRDEVFSSAVALAERIATMSGPVVKTAKQTILTAEESHLAAGMASEKLFYYSTFSLNDFHEGQRAFLEKRSPIFAHH